MHIATTPVRTRQRVADLGAAVLAVHGKQRAAAQVFTRLLQFDGEAEEFFVVEGGAVLGDLARRAARIVPGRFAEIAHHFRVGMHGEQGRLIGWLRLAQDQAFSGDGFRVGHATPIKGSKGQCLLFHATITKWQFCDGAFNVVWQYFHHIIDATS
ncbi:hypothetical protein D3C81_1433260 [compost metagenome]